MDKSEVLEALAIQFDVPPFVFKAKCLDTKPKSGIPTLSLIEQGAVLGDFAGYLKRGEDAYEPCEKN